MAENGKQNLRSMNQIVRFMLDSDDDIDNNINNNNNNNNNNDDNNNLIYSRIKNIHNNKLEKFREIISQNR